MEQKIERLACNEKTIEMQTYMVICQAHPEWRAQEIEKHVNEPIYRETAMRLLLANDLSKRLEVECPSYDRDQCIRRAFRIMQDIQPELFQNINEWLDGKKLSDIKIHGVSLNDVINQYEDVKIHFLKGLDFMIAWKNTGYANSDYHKRYFAHSISLP